MQRCLSTKKTNIQTSALAQSLWEMPQRLEKKLLFVANHLSWHNPRRKHSYILVKKKKKQLLLVAQCWQEMQQYLGEQTDRHITQHRAKLPAGIQGCKKPREQLCLFTRLHDSLTSSLFFFRAAAESNLTGLHRKLSDAKQRIKLV